MPWVVAGTGAAVTAVGGGLYLRAKSDYASFDESFNAECIPEGCRDGEVPELTSQLDRARTLETTARISFVAGGAILAAGAVLVLLNQATEPSQERATARTFVAPVLGPGAAGIRAGISF